MIKRYYAVICWTMALVPAFCCAQKPVISYPTPQVYTINTTISPISPTNTGGPVIKKTTLDTPIISPRGVAVDASGNVYVAANFNNAIKKIPAGGGGGTTIGSGFDAPTGVIVDASGNVFVADAGNFAVKEIPANGGAIITLGAGIRMPYGIAMDRSGNLFVSDFEDNSIKEILANGGSTVTIATGFNNPCGLTIDTAGNLFVADRGNNLIKKIPTNGGSVVNVGAGFYLPIDVAVDKTGNLYVADYNNNAVKEISAATGLTTTIYNTSSLAPSGITVSSAGRVYVSSTGTNPGSVIKLLSPGGFTVTPALPQGLIFDSNTGTISGTPTVATSATNYTVTAYNSSGSSSVKINITVNGFPAPVVSYATPQAYRVGQTIDPLTPASSGVGTVNSGSPVVIASGLSSIIGVATDNSGNVYVTEAGDDKVDKIAAGTGEITQVPGDFSRPTGVAVDSAGNIFVANFNNNIITKIPAGGGANTTILPDFESLYGIAVDKPGNIYVSDALSYHVKKISAVNYNSQLVIGSGFNQPTGLAADILGNVYVADRSNSQIKKILASNGSTVLLTNAFGNPNGVAVDTEGDVFFANIASNSITGFMATGQFISFGSGFSTPAGLAIGSDNTIYVTNSGTGQVEKLPRLGGYAISPALPPGLIFDISTGTISGTPLAGSPPTDYTVKAYNLGGTTSTTLNLRVAGKAGLSGLAINLGKLTPAFTTTNLNYTVSVNEPDTAVFLTPTAIEPTAMILVDGTAVRSGFLSQAIPLSIGKNTATVKVTSADGVTTKTYTITIGRGSPNATLSVLKISRGSLSPVFNSAKMGYTANVVNGVTSMTVTPTVADTTATITVNGTPVISGSASGAIELSAGQNTISIVVTAQDGVTTATYTLTVTRPPSTISTLSDLKISRGTLTPVFSVATTSYSASVANGVASITLTPTATDPTAAITVNGVAVASGSASQNIPLVVGPNTITTVVTAQDGVTQKTYTLVVTEAKSSNNNLLSLKPSAGTLSPTFTAATTSYTESVANSVTSITITPATVVTTSTVKVRGTAVTSGTASASIPLGVGANTINTIVTAQDGTAKTYVITVTRAAAPSATLSALAISAGTLTPAFVATTTSYTASVPNTVSSVTVTPTVSDPTATVKVRGTVVTSGTASAPIPLSVGANTINTIVSVTGGTAKTYTITVTKAAANADSFVPGIGVQTPFETPSLNDDVILVHQGVSPNGDGVNDFLVIDGIQAYPDNKLSIMNRNGQLIYEASGYDNSSKVFDGHSNKNGQMQLPGTYFYQLDYTVKGVTRHKTGFLVLKY